ncbi:MAG: ATP-binding protein [Gammaproteobacteria bacterium]|nr:ATP-binding protein [Gammaproteobacteria bacterium]
MNILKNLGIHSKLLIVYISITGLMLAIAFTIITSLNLKSSKNNIISDLNVVADIVADSSVASLAFSDFESAGSNLSLLKSHKSVVFACIRTAGNNVFAEYDLDVKNIFICDDFDAHENIIILNGYVDLFKPVFLDGEPIGRLQIKASLSELTERTIRSAQISLIIFIGLMLVTVLISRRIMRFITDPITSLKDLAQKVSRNKDYSLRMEKTTDDEVGVLIGSFNNMLDQIQNRDSALIEEKEKAEALAESAKNYALKTEKMNVDLENEIRERARIEDELQELNETLEDKVYERTSELKELNEKIGDIARNAGMAEVASGVLHNVGNVLNSVNVSASVIREHVRKSKAENLNRIVMMLEENKDNLAGFISEDDKGRQIPRFLSLLADQLNAEKEGLYNELDELASNIDHIKNVISMQQSYAGSYGVREKVVLSDLVEDALKINLQGMKRYGIKVVKNYNDIKQLYVDKHKTLQVIINLISNAKYALVDSANTEKEIILNISNEDDMARLEVRDTGIGIEKKDVPHLFEYGFKKRRGGHGFGLHHSAIVANELGGSVSVKSDGLGKGASFVLLLPYDKQITE